MTLADLLKLANEVTNAAVLGDHVRGDALRLARAISDLLTAETCGWERPVSGVRDGEPFVEVPASWDACVSPADARVMAALLLKAADSAEETNAKT